LEVGRFRSFFEGFFNIVRLGILPQLGSYFWKSWSNFHENVSVDLSFDK